MTQTTKTTGTKAPYSFEEWLERRGVDLAADCIPEVQYDGYVMSLEKLGYDVFGNCYAGITVSMKEVI